MMRFIRLFAVVCGFVLSAASLASAGDRDAGGSPARSAVARVSGEAPSTVATAYRSSLGPIGQLRGAANAIAGSARSPIASAPSSPAVPVVTSGFDAIGDIDGATPADPTGALGEGFFLTAVNVSWALFDRTGVPLLGPEPLRSVDPSLAGGLTFDPKIVYDQYNDTFVMVFLVFDQSPRTSQIVVTTIPNATAVDTSTWCTTLVDGDNLAGDGDQWADYPGLGYTADRVTITTNQFSFSDEFRYAQILSFEKTQLYDCTIPDPQMDVLVGTQTLNADGSLAFTLQPAQTVGGTGNDQFLLSFELRGRDSFLTIWRLRPGASGPSLKRATIPTGSVKRPFPAAQGGVDPTDPEFFWDAGDLRLINAFYDSDTNRLYAAHTVRKDFKPDVVFQEGYIEAAARWYEIAPAEKIRSSERLRTGLIGEPEVEIGWPVVATDDAGNLFVTYNRASPAFDEFISAWIAEIEPGSNTSSEQVLDAGQGVYDVSNRSERWGDYNAIGRDPLLGSAIFAINQYATASNAFQQSVHLVTHG
jgi:hypothetical protein